MAVMTGSLLPVYLTEWFTCSTCEQYYSKTAKLGTKGATFKFWDPLCISGTAKVTNLKIDVLQCVLLKKCETRGQKGRGLRLTYLFTWLSDLPVVCVNRWVCWWGHCQVSSLWMTCSISMTYQLCQVDEVLPGLLCNTHDMSHLHLLTFSLLCTRGIAREGAMPPNCWLGGFFYGKKLALLGVRACFIQ